MNKESKIYVAGHNGLVGSAIVRKLKSLDYTNIVLKNHSELDLCRQKDVENFFEEEKPEYVFLAAAKVGGIYANENYPAEFIYNNLTIESNLIHSSFMTGVNKLLFLGSSCIFPKFATQPIKEEYLLSGMLEPTNEPYAIAKIAGIKMCESYNRQYNTNYISVMPTNLYGPNDNFNLKNSHVLPSLIRKFHEAKLFDKENVEIWGTGSPKREFLHVDDLADACIYLMQRFDYKDIGPFVNIGTGKDITIRQLAEVIKKIVGFQGELIFNTSMPDGTPRKLLDVSKMSDLGWQATTSIKSGIKNTYQWYLDFCVNNT